MVPTPCAASSSADGTQVPIPPGLPYKNPPRQSYPKEVLKHQFMPYGSLVNVTNNEMDIDTDDGVAMNVDIDIEPPEPQPTLSQKTKKQRKTATHPETPIKASIATEAGPEEQKAKGMKRKGESLGTTESPANIEPPEPQPTPLQKTKKQKKTVTHSETPIKPSTATEAGPEEKKAKGMKRRGESAGTPESPATRKSKRFKT